jgi:Rps23 Pro-64 3,4-dihydroxylase Tpa1-like proline 4-hydroxylase
MKVIRPTFAAPVLCIDDFLAEDDAQAVAHECIELKKVFMPAQVFDGAHVTKIDAGYRSNDVVYLDQIFRSAPERSSILSIMSKKIWDDECRSLWHEQYLIFDIINYCTSREAVLSRYGDGHFYSRHKDTRWDHITQRLVTLIYYSAPSRQAFSGGTLTLWSGEEHLPLDPKHNRAIVFPSFVDHEVHKVATQGQNWEDTRFSLNYWMGFR